MFYETLRSASTCVFVKANIVSNVQFENVTLHHREALLLRPDELSYGVIKIQATKVMFFDHPYMALRSWILLILITESRNHGFLSFRTSRPVQSLLKSWESFQSLRINQPVPAAKEMTFWPWWMVCDVVISAEMSQEAVLIPEKYAAEIAQKLWLLWIFMNQLSGGKL